MTRRTLATLLVLGSGACGDGATAPSNVFGTYTLRTVFQLELPAVIVEIGTTIKIEITAGSLTLNEDSTCSQSRSLRQTDDGVVSTRVESFECTYTRIDGPLTLAFQGGGTMGFGTVEGSSIKLSQDGLSLLFTK